MDNSLEIKVVIAEDEDFIRNRLRINLLSLDPSIHVMGEAEDGQEALNLINQQQPDLLVTDIRMPVIDGLELIETVHMNFPHIQMVITTGYAEFEYARKGLQYGVAEYLLKPITVEDLKAVYPRIKASIIKQKQCTKEMLDYMSKEEQQPAEIVSTVQQYLRENFACDDISMEKIARQFNFNTSYLSKIFFKHTGFPPSKYLTTLRINEAKYLLKEQPHLSIKKVGEAVGYPDQFYFSRVFKQATGMTPKDYQSKA